MSDTFPSIMLIAYGLYEDKLNENLCNKIFYIFTMHMLNAYFGWILHGFLRKAALAQTGSEAL